MRILNFKLNKLLSSPDKREKVFIFVHKSGPEDRLCRILKDICAGDKGNFHVIGFDHELPDKLNGLDIQISHSWDYLGEEDCAYADNFFFKRLLKDWFILDGLGRDYLDRHAQELFGRTNEFEFINANFTLIKYMESMRNIFLRQGPKRIIIIEEGRLLRDVLGIFSAGHDFRSVRIDPVSFPGMLVRLKNRTKAFLADLCILLLDFFVSRYVFISKRFKNRIIIDHRLYQKFCGPQDRERFLPCYFEKGLKVRLEHLSKGIFYLPLRAPSCFDLFLGLSRMPSFLRRWRKIRIGLQDKDVFKYHGLDFSSVILRYVFRVFLLVLPRSNYNMRTLKKFIEFKKAKLIVMRNDAKELERTASEAAAGKIKSLVVQHGIFGDVNIGNALYADITAVWGRASIDWFGRSGYGQDRFVVTGNPAYDDLYRRISGAGRQAVREKIFRGLGLDPSKKTVVFLTSSRFPFGSAFWRGDQTEAILRGILDSLSRMGGKAQLIVKLHPYDEKPDSYAGIINEFSRDIKVARVKEINVFDVLEAGDLVIMVDRSSSGLEALILDKPLIAVELYCRLVEVPFIEDGVAPGVKKIEDIDQAIIRCLYDKKTLDTLSLNRKRFVSSYAYKIDGKATARVMELIEAAADRRAYMAEAEGPEADNSLKEVMV